MHFCHSFVCMPFAKTFLYFCVLRKKYSKRGTAELRLGNPRVAYVTAEKVATPVSCWNPIQCPLISFGLFSPHKSTIFTGTLLPDTAERKGRSERGTGMFRLETTTVCQPGVEQTRGQRERKNPRYKIHFASRRWRGGETCSPGGKPVAEWKTEAKKGGITTDTYIIPSKTSQEDLRRVINRSLSRRHAGASCKSEGSYLWRAIRGRAQRYHRSSARQWFLYRWHLRNFDESRGRWPRNRARNREAWTELGGWNSPGGMRGSIDSRNYLLRVASSFVPRFVTHKLNDRSCSRARTVSFLQLSLSKTNGGTERCSGPI